MGLNNLRSLYQTLVLDYASHPRNNHKIENADQTETVHNPSCGDTINVFIKLNSDQTKIDDVAFTGSGCTISQASASMMTVAVKGKTIDEALEMTKFFSDLSIGKEVDDKALAMLGDAAVLTQVMQFPARIKCATISWWALEQALLKKGQEND